LLTYDIYSIYQNTKKKKKKKKLGLDNLQGIIKAQALVSGKKNCLPETSACELK
jgi:hypothetical protein